MGHLSENEKRAARSTGPLCRRCGRSLLRVEKILEHLQPTGTEPLERVPRIFPLDDDQRACADKIMSAQM